MLIIHRGGDLVNELRLNKPVFCEVKFEIENFSVGSIHGMFVVKNMFSEY